MKRLDHAGSDGVEREIVKRYQAAFDLGVIRLLRHRLDGDGFLLEDLAREIKRHLVYELRRPVP